MNFLKQHPFGVKAFFETSTVLTFAIEKEKIISFLPPYLTLDTFQNKWKTNGLLLPLQSWKPKCLDQQGFHPFWEIISF